jgi:ketosteroid isomerase-like protein
MKTLILLMTASLFLTGAATAKEMSPAEKQISAAEAAWSKAFVEKDIKTLSSLMAEDWTGQSEAPKIMTRAALLQSVKTGEMSATMMKNHDLVIRLIGNIAIVQGGDDEKSTFKGKDTSGAYNWTDILEKRGGNWISIASHVTKVSK